MTSLIPSVNVTISGNRCGGCCGESSVRRKRPPTDYIIILNKDAHFIAIPKHALPDSILASKADDVFRKVNEFIRAAYNVSIDEIPMHPRIVNFAHPPSVADVMAIESAALGYVEGLKRAKSQSEDPTSPVMARTSDSSDSK